MVVNIKINSEKSTISNKTTAKVSNKNQASKNDNLFELDLIDIIDEISICSFISLENLKKYAAKKGLFFCDNLSFNINSVDDDKITETYLPSNKSYAFQENSNNMRLNIISGENSPFKYNTRSKNLKSYSTKYLDDAKQSVSSVKKEVPGSELPEDQFDTCNSIVASNAFDDGFLKKLDDNLIKIDLNNDINEFFENNSKNNNDGSMIWQPRIKQCYNEIKNVPINRSVSISSSSSSDSSKCSSAKVSSLNLIECGNEHCRLGCICDSLLNLNANSNNSSNKTSISNNYSKQQRNEKSSSKNSSINNHNNINSNSNNATAPTGIFRDHCGRFECMFECTCYRRLRSTTRMIKTGKNEEKRNSENDSKKKKTKPENENEDSDEIIDKDSVNFVDKSKKKNLCTSLSADNYNKAKSREKNIVKKTETSSRKHRPSSNESFNSKFSISTNSSSSRSRSSSLSSSSSKSNQEEPNSNNEILKATQKLRKSKRVKRRNKKYSSLMISNNSSKINNKFKDCYYYYFDKDYEQKTKSTKACSNKGLNSSKKEKINEVNAKNNTSNKVSSENGKNKLNKIIQKINNRKSTFLNKEILSLIKLNSSINYDKNKMNQKDNDSFREYFDNESDKYNDTVTVVALIYSDNNKSEIKCNKYKNLLNKKASISVTLFESYEHKVILKIKVDLNASMIPNPENDISFVFSLKFQIFTSKWHLNLKFVDPVLILISKILYELKSSNVAKESKLTWKEFEFDYNNDLAIRIVSSVQRNSSKNENSSLILVQIKSFERKSDQSLEKKEEKIIKSDLMFNKISELIKNISSNSNLISLKFKNKQSEDQLISFNDAFNQEIKADNRETNFTSQNDDINFDMSILKPKISINSQKRIQLYDYQQHRQKQNVLIDHVSLKKNNDDEYFSDSFSIDERVCKRTRHLPRLLSRNNLKYKSSNQESQNDSNKLVNLNTKINYVNANTTRLNLKYVDTLFEKVILPKEYSTDQNLVKLISICSPKKFSKQYMNTTELNINSNNHQISSENISLSEIQNLRPKKILHHDLVKINPLDTKTGYFDDELQYFNKLNLDKNKSEFFNYPFYDPFTDHNLISSIYNTSNSKELINDVSNTLNDIITVVCLFEQNNQPKHNINSEMKKNSVELSKKSDFSNESQVNLDITKKPNIIVINKHHEKYKNSIIASNSTSKLALTQHENTRTITNTHVDKALNNTQVLSSTSLAKPYKTLIKIVSSNSNTRYTKSNQSLISETCDLYKADSKQDCNLDNNLTIQHPINMIKPLIIKKINTPRILIKPKIVETNPNKVSSSVVLRPSITSFVPIRPKINFETARLSDYSPLKQSSSSIFQLENKNSSFKPDDHGKIN
jgi:hypothetical protein